MTALATFQRALAAHVLDGTAPSAGLIDGGAHFSVTQRLAVYHQAYRLRLAEALAADFPVLHGLLGEAGFERLTAAYIAAQPSRSFTLRGFGAALPGFLGHHAPYRRQPWLKAAAAFEWALLAAFDAADVPPLSAADLASVPAEQFPRLRFRLQPALHLLRLTWNIPAAWRAVQTGEQAPALQRLPVPTYCLVWRREERVYFRSLPDDEAALLKAVRGGRSFASACGAMTRAGTAQDPAHRAAELLSAWLADTLLIAA